jgi:hypothetical protein
MMMPHHLAASLQVGLEDSVFQELATHVPPGVDVDDRHGLRVVDHEIAPRRQVHPPLQSLADLAFHTVGIEQALATLIQFHPLHELGGGGLQERLDLPHELSIIHQHLGELFAEQIAHDLDGQLGFRVGKGRSLLRLQPLLHHAPELL